MLHKFVNLGDMMKIILDKVFLYQVQLVHFPCANVLDIWVPIICSLLIGLLGVALGHAEMLFLQLVFSMFFPLLGVHARHITAIRQVVVRCALDWVQIHIIWPSVALLHFLLRHRFYYSPLSAAIGACE